MYPPPNPPLGHPLAAPTGRVAFARATVVLLALAALAAVAVRFAQRSFGAPRTGTLFGRGGSIGPMPAPPPGLRATQLALGSNHACALQHDGTVLCWGRDNGYGQLGDGTFAVPERATPVRGLTGVTAIAGGFQHTCALLADRTVRCWGENASGQLGDDGSLDRPTPVAVAGLSGVTALYAGPVQTCARLGDGTLRCWGQLPASGHEPGAWGGTYPQHTPVAVQGLAAVDSVGAGFSHLCALTHDGATSCWGSNFLGELGDGTGSSRTTAAPVPGLSGARGVVSSNAASCALTRDGAVECWGFGAQALFDDAHRPDCTHQRCALSGLAGGAQLAANDGLVCVRRGDGSVGCVGSLRWVLDDGTAHAFRDGARDVPGVGDAADLALGVSYACIRRLDDTVRCWSLREPPRPPMPGHENPLRHEAESSTRTRR